MFDLISPVLQWINLHPHLAGLATFFISAAESIAIIGTIVPGTVMMTALGTLAGAGVMPLWSTILWAILGAIVGDGVSYWIGYYFKDRLRDVWPFKSHPYLLTSGERFFRKHGGKSVFIGRFVGPVRALVPVVAGMLNMKPWRFTLSNVTSAIGWAPAYMLPGIALGAASLELPPDIAVHAILMLLLLGLFIIFCLWVIQKILSLIGTQINQSLTLLWQRLHRSRFFSPLTNALKHHDTHKTYGQLTLAFYLLVTVGFFTYLAAYVYSNGSQNIFINNFFFHLFRSLRTPTGDNIMLSITLLGETKVLVPIITILCFWLVWIKRWRVAAHVFALAIITFTATELIKHYVHSPRPWGIVQSPSSASFPSGHSTFATAFYLGITLLLAKKTKRIYRRFMYIIASIIILAVVISRMYLGAHWFTDVVGGMMLGSSTLMLVVLSYNRYIGKSLRPLALFGVTLLALLLSYSTFFYTHFNHYKINYTQVDWPVHIIDIKSWWNQNGDNLPRYRVNRFGFSTQILNLQLIGNLEDIKKTLLKNGWEIPPKSDWISALHRISDIESAEHLPLVSALYLDKEPVLILTKRANSNKKLIVLRLWSPNVSLKGSDQPLWVGTVDITPRTYSWLFKSKHSNEINLTADQVFSNSATNYDIKQISVLNTHRHHPELQTIVLVKPKSL